MSVSVIIPAYNEEKTIGNVLRSVKSIPLIDEIIVVNDSSTDDTSFIAKNYGVYVIDMPENIGKGGAISAGLKTCKFEIILLLDADLIGLKMNHIYDLLIPVISEDFDMAVGIFKHGRTVTDFAQKIAPKLSGQRALKRKMLEEIGNIDLIGYGLEASLTKLVKNKSYKVKEVYLKDLTHLTKEEKMGVMTGFSSRVKMYWDIVKVMKKNIKY